MNAWDEYLPDELDGRTRYQLADAGRRLDRTPAGMDEFTLAGVDKREAERVGAPYVASVPAVLECCLERKVALGGAPNTPVIGRPVALR